jgi:hypothetical protein
MQVPFKNTRNQFLHLTIIEDHIIGHACQNFSPAQPGRKYNECKKRITSVDTVDVCVDFKQDPEQTGRPGKPAKQGSRSFLLECRNSFERKIAPELSLFKGIDNDTDFIFSSGQLMHGLEALELGPSNTSCFQLVREQSVKRQIDEGNPGLSLQFLIHMPNGKT